MAEYPVPKRVSVDDIKNILKGYYLEGAHNESVSSDDVETTIQLVDRVGRQTEFFADLGLIVKDGYERALTSDGEAIAESLVGGSSDLARKLMREALQDWEFTDKITGFIGMQQDSISEQELLDYISANATSSNKQGLRALIDLYIWSDIIAEDNEGNFRLADGSNVPPEPSKPEAEEKTSSEKRTSGAETGLRGKGAHGLDNVRINLEFTSQDTSKEIQQTILSVRKALEEDIGVLDEELDEESG